jgi:tagatose 1,6-diphosphate aldolase
MTHATAQVTEGKVNGISACANEQGVIAALAIDQRGSLQRALGEAKGHPVDAAELVEFKAIVTQVLSPFASSVLLEPEYGLAAVARRAPGAGVLLAYEKSGYDTTVKGKFPDLLPGWSVRRLVAAGAQGIKIVMYYDPDAETYINDVKHAFIERVGAECRAGDVPFFLEPVTYADGVDTRSAAYARLKPAKVMQAMTEFSKPEYGVDILKVEIPIDPRYLEGSPSSGDAEIVYRRVDALEHFQAAAAVAGVPFIYLSAGVSDEVFREMLELAAEAGVPYSGVLCGRATWQGGLGAYAEGGAAALREWLEDRGVRNIQALNAVLAAGAQDWRTSQEGRIGS